MHVFPYFLRDRRHTVSTFAVCTNLNTFFGYS
nr:MAG TPA: hypothetical protein [Caudoviricetes sp.]